jgi:nitrate reductase gamma subunit
MISESLLHFVEFELQIIALSIFAILYGLRVRNLMKLTMPKETAPAKGNPSIGIAVSFASLFNPWSMESTTKHLGRWVEFALYHLAALAAIGATFTLPFAPQIMTYPVRIVFAVFLILGVLVGFMKILRRFVNPHLRYVSTPDDYFSLFAVQVYFIAAAGCLVYYTDLWRFIYFLITALFLIYVPFSKISHYLYWFFARTFLGLRYGRRGVIPRREASA